MARTIEVGCVIVSLAFFVGAAHSWLINESGQGTHGSLFLAAGLVALGFGLSGSQFGTSLRRRHLAGPPIKSKRRLVAALVSVARHCQDASPRDVMAAYLRVTGQRLEPAEVRKAISYMRSSRAAPVETILAKIKDEDEKRRILVACCEVWSSKGVDSEHATRAMERVAAAMGMHGNDINTALDASWSREANRVLKNVETLARRTVSRATTGAQRITTRIRGLG